MPVMVDFGLSPMGNQQSKTGGKAGAQSAHQGVHAEQFWDSLKHAVNTFHKKEYAPSASLYSALTAGQAPYAMVVSCSDSRVQPTRIFQLAPGDAFGVQTVGALLPPPGSTDSAVAALEFAITSLKVSHIIVVGHTGCGAAKAIANSDSDSDSDSNAPALSSWLSYGAEALSLTKAVSGSTDPSRENLLRELERQIVSLTLKNLSSYSFVQDSKVQLHGCIYNIGNGSIEAWDYPDSPTNAETIPSTQQ